MLSRAVRVWTGAVQPEWKVTVAAAVSMTETAQGLDLSDDRALVRACLAGNQPAFDVLVERHRRAIYQLCYRFVGNHEDASDLSQDVFLRAHRGLKRFRGQSSLSTLVVPNRCQRVPRSRQRQGTGDRTDRGRPARRPSQRRSRGSRAPGRARVQSPCRHHAPPAQATCDPHSAHVS